MQTFFSIEKTGAGAYRYGFNGQEKSTEINPSGDHYTAEFWEYDSRIGRRWNRDRVYKHSPYEVLGSNPIWNIDPNGADTIKFTTRNTIFPSKAGLSDMRVGGGGSSYSSITVLQAPGKDVFFYEVYTKHADVNGNMNSGKPRITQFYPNDYSSATGITRSENDVLPGTHKDGDFITLAKFINASPKLGDYLVNHNANYNFIQGYASEVQRDETARKFAAPIADLLFLAVGIGEARIAARAARLNLAADDLVVSLKGQYGGNVTVMQEGNPVFRVHQPGTHGNTNATLTEFSTHTNPQTGAPFLRPNPKVSAFDEGKLNILEQASKGQGGYSIKTKGGR